MAVLNTVQAENFTLQNGAELATDSEGTPNGANNTVLILSGPSNVSYSFASLPVGTTKIVLFVKKQTAGITDANINVHYVGTGSPQYGVFEQNLSEEGLHSLTLNTLPTSGNNQLNIDGNKIILDRIEFQDDSSNVSTADIIAGVNATPTKSSGVNNFVNNGPNAIPVGATIQFTVQIAGSAITLTPQSTKGTFAPATVSNGNILTLTLTQAIASGETFGISYTNAPFKTKATSVDFIVGPVTGFVENNANNATTSPSFVPSADLSVTAIAATTNDYLFKIKNIGTDEIEAGQVIRIVKSELGAGTPTTAKGSCVVNGNNIDITLSSNLALNEEFNVIVTLTTPATASYTGTVTSQWQSNISDTVTENNTATLSYTATVITPNKISDLSVILVSATATGYSIKLKNNGTDTIPSGSVIKILPSSLPSGTLTTTKGTLAANGLNYDLTLNSNLALNEEFIVNVTFTNVSTGYNGSVNVQWVSSITDNVISNNTVSLSYAQSSGGGSGSYTYYQPTASLEPEPKPKSTIDTIFQIVLPVSLFSFICLLLFKLLTNSKDEKRN